MLCTNSEYCNHCCELLREFFSVYGYPNQNWFIEILWDTRRTTGFILSKERELPDDFK